MEDLGQARRHDHIQAGLGDLLRLSERARYIGRPWTGGACAAIIVAIVGGCGGGSAQTASAPLSTNSENTAAQATGGGGEGASTSTTRQESNGLSEAQAIRATLEAALASRDPEQACVTYVTDDYVRKAYGSRQGCLEAQAPGSAARFLTSLRARVHGAEATATAVPSGGPYDGSMVTASLVKEKGTWKVDALHANVPVGP